ncbi:MAG: amino acid permease [Rhizobiales bacterium 62-17]|nr:amino acid permease [Hyphomicrobiales bacterium]OJY03451.1 MAG: amino acid permease [Rhizobiales bacterium 62-17]
MSSETAAAPRRVLTIADAVAFFVGIVIGVGIFRTPPIVASATGSEVLFIGAWIAGGLATLIGALCYAELAAAYPDAGGEYQFLSRAYGHRLAVLFAWARGTVIQTGAIALVGFVFGDYAQQLLPLGPNGPGIYAAISVILFTAVNIAGTQPGAGMQKLLETCTVLAIIVVVVVGFTVSGTEMKPVEPGAGGMLGLAMVLVLLSYGGWNEIAYLSGELRDVKRDMTRAIFIGTAIVTVLYVAFNLALLKAFGLGGIAASKAPGADLMQIAAGSTGVAILALTVCLSSLSTLNGTIFTGARVYYALGRDLPLIAKLGVWNERGDNPANAFLLQGAISLALVVFGLITRDGFSTMVDYTAPVFWFFLMLTGLSLFIFRIREPNRPRPFKVPLYPLTPAIFVGICAYLLYSSLAYTGWGALVGIAVVIIGLPLVLVSKRATAQEPA